MERTGEGVCAPKGFSATGVACGLKAHGRRDLALIVSKRESSAAALFTTNLVCGAPISVSRQHITGGVARAIVVNAGCANACTGARGVADAERMCSLVASGLNCPPQQVLVASTGVIGRPLPMDRIERGIEAALAEVSKDGGAAAADAIITTDTFPKTVKRVLSVGGHTVTIGGMAKGAGMIAPRLATMLAFITTDALLAPEDARALLRNAAETSFNRLTIDGDTSTSDMLALLANGESGAPALKPGTDDYARFAEQLTDACRELAKMIARDGEGATKFITVHVSGAPSNEDAHLAARTVAESPLVKTAFFGGDPNWGRIAAALGRSGVFFDPGRLTIRVDDLLLFENGMPAAFPLAAAEEKFREKVIAIHADLGNGKGEAEVYTCDLSYEYVRINAEYTT
ncbi:MAG TPA: bifunctional glutamate N-acetyltransferase/amino-acid acetyltransferase ArgJ [Candidatus Latescibacteria bacterium]|nr:bifunctional glutamate N-acetyltransferase/amino-acid acetyltransferase ArgJ [Candidatus Latescibacterota bacterium]